MSLRSVTETLQQALDGQVYPPFPAMVAHTEYEQVTKAGETPQAFIWAADGQEERLAGARGPGIKQLRHTIQIYLVAVFRASIRPEIGLQSLRDLIGGVQGTVGSMPMPQTITDSVTGVASRMMAVAESARWEVPNQESSALYRLTAYHALLEIDVLELVQ